LGQNIHLYVFLCAVAGNIGTDLFKKALLAAIEGLPFSQPQLYKHARFIASLIFLHRRQDAFLLTDETVKQKVHGYLYNLMETSKQPGLWQVQNEDEFLNIFRYVQSLKNLPGELTLFSSALYEQILTDLSSKSLNSQLFLCKIFKRLQLSKPKEIEILITSNERRIAGATIRYFAEYLQLTLGRAGATQSFYNKMESSALWRLNDAINTRLALVNLRECIMCVNSLARYIKPSAELLRSYSLFTKEFVLGSLDREVDDFLAHIETLLLISGSTAELEASCYVLDDIIKVEFITQANLNRFALILSGLKAALPRFSRDYPNLKQIHEQIDQIANSRGLMPGGKDHPLAQLLQKAKVDYEYLLLGDAFELKSKNRGEKRAVIMLTPDSFIYDGSTHTAIQTFTHSLLWKSGYQLKTMKLDEMAEFEANPGRFRERIG
jgi:hypothetical protein